jgi:hypothetical protein
MVTRPILKLVNRVLLGMVKNWQMMQLLDPAAAANHVAGLPQQPFAAIDKIRSTLLRL